MSFYGNSFYYTAESFARIVLQNSGLNKYITILPDENPFTVVPSDTKKELDAPQRNSGLGIQSGNHWIKLATSGNTFQILHNGPGSDDPNIQTFQGCEVENGEVDKEDQQKPVIMGWNQKIKVPVISYDTAGHIIPTTDVTYLKMPLNPTSALEGRMQQIDGKNTKGEDEEPTDGQSLKTELYARMQQIDGKDADGADKEPTGGQSFKTQLYNRMKQIDGKDKNGVLDENYPSVTKELNGLVTELTSKLSSLNKAVADSGTALTNSQDALNEVSIVKNTFYNLDTRIKALEEKAGLIPPDASPTT